MESWIDKISVWFKFKFYVSIEGYLHHHQPPSLNLNKALASGLHKITLRPKERK